MKKLKIAIIASYPFEEFIPGYSGYIRPVPWVINLANALFNLGNEIHIISGISPRHKIWKKYLPKNGINFHFFMTIGRLSKYVCYIYEIIKVKNILRNIKPDVVHGQGLEGFCGLASIFTGFPYVITIHGILNEYYSYSYRKFIINKFLERVAIKLANNIILLNKYVLEVVQKYDRGNFHKKNITNIPNSIDIEFFKKNVQKMNGNQINILFCGAIIIRKGLLELLEAINLLVRRNYNIKLFIVGFMNKNLDQDHYFSIVNSFIEENLVENVEMVGYIEPKNIPFFFPKMDLLVLPSKSETAPMVISEAMASSLPVVAYDVGGVKYMVMEGKTGFVVPRNNIQILSEKIEILINDKEIRYIMGLNAVEIAKKEYHPRSVAIKTLDFYKEVIKSWKT